MGVIGLPIPFLIISFKIRRPNVARAKCLRRRRLVSSGDELNAPVCSTLCTNLAQAGGIRVEKKSLIALRTGQFGDDRRGFTTESQRTERAEGTEERWNDRENANGASTCFTFGCAEWATGNESIVLQSTGTGGGTRTRCAAGRFPSEMRSMVRPDLTRPFRPPEGRWGPLVAGPAGRPEGTRPYGPPDDGWFDQRSSR
jgi:hypothetical protein